MRIEWQVAVFCTLSCCFCGLINRKRVMIGQLDCSSLLTRVGFAHIYLEAWLRWSVMLQEIRSSWLRCWLWLPGYRAILRKKTKENQFPFNAANHLTRRRRKSGRMKSSKNWVSGASSQAATDLKKKQDKRKLKKLLYTSRGYIWKSLSSLVFSRCF